MIIIGQISIQSLTTHGDFFQLTLTLLAKIFVWNKSGLKQSVTETSLMIYRKIIILLDARCSVSSHHGIPQSVIQEAILIAKSIRTWN